MSLCSKTSSIHQRSILVLRRRFPLIIPNGFISIRSTFQTNTEATNTRKEFNYSYMISHYSVLYFYY